MDDTFMPKSDSWYTPAGLWMSIAGAIIGAILALLGK
jgi:hypothetical protein